MKKIVLFSPNGYVGSFVKKGLLEENDIQLFELTRNSNLEKYKGSYDVLVYSAAITSARSERAEKYVQDNVVAAIRMVDFCREHGIKRIIYFSSDEIYGELNTDQATVKAVMINPNLYATTKYLAEKIILESEIPCYILRLPGIVGQVWGNNFIYRLIDKIRNNERVELYNLEKKFNNILDIEDLVRFTVILCNTNICADNRNEIFLLGNEESIELKDIVFYIKKIYQSKSVICNEDGRNKRYFTLDVAKAVEYGYCSKNIRTIIDELCQMRKDRD